MELYQQQQFGFFLETATERFVARLEERFRGPDKAVEMLREDPESAAVLLKQFTDAVFTLNWLFRGGPQILPPGAHICGIDPTEDDLGCESFPPCSKL